MKRIIIIIVLFGAAFQPMRAQEKVIPLYPGAIPNSRKAPAGYAEYTDSNGLIMNVTHPTLTAYLPAKEKATGTAVIICPGGGYRLVASERKSALFAKAFNDAGIAAFVLKYRLPADAIMPDKTIGPLQDLQTAIVTVRARATEWGLNPRKIGVLGISAGGHMATTAATRFTLPAIEQRDSSLLRPDFLVLLYPVVIFDTAIPSGPRERLIGAHPTAATLRRFSNEKQVTANTPPSFIVHAADDELVGVEHSLAFFSALHRAGVKSALHVLQSGDHGFGPDHPDNANNWFKWCLQWLGENGF